MEEQSLSQHQQAEDLDSGCQNSAQSTSQHVTKNIQVLGDMNYYTESNIVQHGKQNNHGELEKRKQTSIDHVRHPIPHFSETKHFTELLNLVQEKSTLILQFYGVPGSGKSEIVRQLAQKFPYEAEAWNGVFVKWGIQYDGVSDVYSGLEELVKQMQRHSLLQNPQDLQDILGDMEKNLARSVVSALCKSNVPVLIIIEDTTANNILLRELLYCINERKTCDDPVKLHIYLTTRSKSIVFPDEEHTKMPHYKIEKVTGFDQEEGLKFLLQDKPADETERNSAIRLYQRFSGSPLGLRVAKGYCRKAKMTYAKYLEWIEDDCEDDVHQEEKELIKEEYGESGQHLFQAIVKPFLVNDQSKDGDKLNWNVLSCLSYFHHDKIPRFLFDRCFHVLRENSVKNPQRYDERDSGRLISKLVNSDMCTDEDDSDLIVFHEVVLHAFQVCQPQSTLRFDILRNAIWIIAGLLTKDLRTRDNLKNMHSLIPHVYNLLENVDKKFEIPRDYEKAILVKMVVSHVYETAAAIAIDKRSFHPLCQGYYKKAIESINWSKIPQYCLTESKASLDDIDKIALHVVEETARAGRELPEGFITEYESAVFSNSVATSLKFLEKASQDKEVFDTMKKALEAGERSEKVIAMLRECGVFLKEETHRDVFFSERLASVLHSWSRMILYADEEKTASLSVQAVWQSSLSHAISFQCKNSFNITLLCEKLSYTTGKIPITLRIKSDTSALKEVKEYCENMLHPIGESVDLKTYEHGLLKEAFAPSHPANEKQMYTNLLKINTRLLKSMEEPESRNDLIQTGERYAHGLFELGCNNVGSVFKSSIFFIHCAKFYAASKNYDQALMCFDKFFMTTDANDETYFGNYCWTIYNFARAVVCSQSQERKTSAINSIEGVLERIDELMRPSLKSKMGEMLVQLNEL